VIHIHNVTRRFGRMTAVNAVSFDIPRGDSVALWGSNGAGKTTLIRCVLGLLRFQGNISVAGHDVASRGKHARQLIGYVPQELGFYDELRVSEALAFFSRLKGLGRPDVAAALESVGLAGSERKRIRELSGGMKQRLALALALRGDPPVLVLDEVTASLDALGRHDFIALLERLTGQGRTLLFASHRIDEVASLAHRVAVLDSGRLAAMLPVAHFVSQQEASSQSSSVLHLTIPASSRSDALRVLSLAGFSPELNGVGVLVPVPLERKAIPIRILAEARVPVDDFEVVSMTDAAAAVKARQEHTE